jgi:predicted kinase
VADHVILINGLPGAGKTTLAALLGPALGVPVIAKDAIKEALAAAAPALPAAAFGPAAAAAMWELAAGTPGGVLLESWWFRPRDRGHAADGLRRSGARRAVEIWCEIPAEVARARFDRRRRGFPYEDEHRARDAWPRWAAQARPLEICPAVMVRTDRPPDLPDLRRRIAAALAADHP